MQNKWRLFWICFIGGGALDIALQSAFLHLTGAIPADVTLLCNGVWTIAAVLSLRYALTRRCKSCGALIPGFTLQMPGKRLCKVCGERS